MDHGLGTLSKNDTSLFPSTCFCTFGKRQNYSQPEKLEQRQVNNDLSHKSMDVRISGCRQCPICQGTQSIFDCFVEAEVWYVPSRRLDALTNSRSKRELHC